MTDKAPRNFELLWLIRLALPDARVIHCRRHPVDTCLSIFFANFSARQDYACDRGDLVFFYRQYERLMDHWRRALPADRFTEVEYETLIADREAETRRLVAFCGLDWDDACLTPERNGRVVKTASLWQARQPVYETSVDRWRRYEPWLGELKELMPAEEAARDGRGRRRLVTRRSRLPYQRLAASADEGPTFAASAEVCRRVRARAFSRRVRGANAANGRGPSA